MNWGPTRAQQTEFSSCGVSLLQHGGMEYNCLATRVGPTHLHSVILVEVTSSAPKATAALSIALKRWHPCVALFIALPMFTRSSARTVCKLSTVHTEAA